MVSDTSLKDRKTFPPLLKAKETILQNQREGMGTETVVMGAS